MVAACKLQMPRDWIDSEVHGDELVLLHSPETAEHDPNYREVARFPLGSSR
jgi:hypothetical protein